MRYVRHKWNSKIADGQIFIEILYSLHLPIKIDGAFAHSLALALHRDCSAYLPIYSEKI